MADSPYLFVYGTLRSGCENRFSRRLTEQGRLLCPARIQGRLYRLGHYPGAVVSGQSGEWVSGEVYQLHDPAATLPMLDRYEGCGPDDTPPHEFIRVEVIATMSSGDTLGAWAYLYNRAVTEEQRILSGDFLAG